MSPLADSELERRGRQIGAIAGRVVALVRDAGHYLQPGEQINELRANASSKVEEIRKELSARTAEWRETVREKSADLGRRSRKGFENARATTNRLGHDYPWHLLLAAGIVGLALGASIRVRRANRAI
ncbi:MAG TPA: hypothetical protein VKW06_22485 [Candidatus Angelobacter sp.]|nr:hypothetical protein [Candidatus Angelobacter sp.]